MLSPSSCRPHAHGAAVARSVDLRSRGTGAKIISRRGGFGGTLGGERAADAALAGLLEERHAALEAAGLDHARSVSEKKGQRAHAAAWLALVDARKSGAGVGSHVRTREVDDAQRGMTMATSAVRRAGVWRIG